MLATTKIFGCIADPIDHVKAPTILTSIFKEKKIDAVMIPIHVNAGSLENVINSLKLIKNFNGMTITIPHKKSLATLCDYLEPNAQFTQSVNWVKFDKNRKLIGNNFDGEGFVNGFKSKNFILKDKNVCLFGAGGAAVSIACSIAKEEIKSLKIINRDHNKAISLMTKIRALSKDLHVAVEDHDGDYSLNNCDIIINATSLGLKQDDKIPFDVEKTGTGSIIADIIMQPEETKLLKQAKSVGRSVHYGKYMIESQIDLVGKFLDLW